MIEEHEVYQRIGAAGFQAIVAAFYRQIPQDDILGPMYPAEDLVGAEDRLRGFLIFRFGGPQDYIAERGHPKLRMRHMPFQIDTAARDRWVELMSAALAEANLDAEATLVMEKFFAQTATFLINRPA